MFGLGKQCHFKFNVDLQFVFEVSYLHRICRQYLGVDKYVNFKSRIEINYK